MTRRRRTVKRITCALLAFVVYSASIVPAAVLAQPPAGELPVEEGVLEDELPPDHAIEDAPIDESVASEIDPETAARLAESAGSPPADDAAPLSLPGGEDKSAVTPQAISLPNAEGSFEGMGESFSPVLSSGTGTFTVPIALPPGRAGVQPSLALTYSTSGGNSDVGFGWSIGVPFISRQTDRGLPAYVDMPRWHAEEDRFLYNGGQELVPVDTAAMAVVDGYGSGAVPAELSGWQQYRARVEGAFMRFFRSPDSTRWVVQSKDGTRFDFGLLPVGDGPTDMVTASRSALQTESPGGLGRIFRWCLTRMSDAHGSTVYYRYSEDDGQRYLSDIHYVSPASCAPGTPELQRSCTAPLSDYAVRVSFDYDTTGRQDVFTSYTSTWRIATAWRLSRITVTAARDIAGTRYLVRRYHLSYDPTSYHSLLREVQIEGRPDALDASTQVYVGALVTESSLSDAIIGRLLPPMTFYYGRPTATSPTAPGFGGIDATVRNVIGSPPHSVQEGRSDLFDVNSDGLPDLIVTDPARYRTSSGAPAVGVFFNGFEGASATPANAGATFSGAVPVPMDASLSGAMTLSNLNVVPMDIDGDGRSDLLHMPRRANYGYFTPTRAADGTTAPVSPANQDWHWTYVPVALPAGVTDPRIDLTRDGARLQVLDVNNDHLVDVVRTTGTVMQTWLNLGWLPGGDGRFGSATYSGTAWTLSTDPIESCLLYDGLPVDFADSEVKLADMNGDGLQDIVKMRRGRLVWWPGRGPGLWGEGPGTCGRGEGAGRGIVMSAPPAELNTELAGVYLSDVNADGAADVVQVRYDAVDVWFNRAGESFTARIIARGTPYTPDYAPRIRFADIDGSGTSDIVWGNASRWQYIDPMGGQKPRVLVGVDNGLGAETTLEYSSSTVDYLADLREAAACTSCERFTWSRVTGPTCPAHFNDPSSAGACFRSGGSPVVSTVVRAVETTDNFHLLGREENVIRTEYAYHDGYYEGIEQELRGFGAADAVAIGDASHPTSYTRTWFHQGRRPDDIATVRLADNPRESLKGRAYLTETFDDDLVYLSSTWSGYTVRELAVGLDGRSIQYAFVHETDELRYDTAPWSAGSGTLVVPAVQWETVSGGTATPGALDTDSMSIRGARYAHLRSTTDSVDNLGHVRQQTAHGRIRGEYGETPSEPIVSHQEPLLVDADGWLFRTKRTYTTGHGTSDDLADTTNTYNATGDPLSSTLVAAIPSGVPGYVFNDDSAVGGDADGFTQVSPQYLVASTSYDTWGNATETCGGASTPGTSCLRYAAVTYDTAYAAVPETESIAAGKTGGGVFVALTTNAVWDRGLGVLDTVTDPNGEIAYLGYDGLGRLTYVRAPPVAGCGSSVPTQRFEYELVPGGAPVSVVSSYQELDCAAVGTSQIRTRSYVDGLGRPRSTALDERADISPRWVVSDIATFSARGSPVLAYQPAFIATADPSPAMAVALPPGVGYDRVDYDAFGRPQASYAADDAPVAFAYTALSTWTWDANDLEPLGPHEGTPSITRTDGHGRVIDQVLWNEVGGLDEYYRLFTVYRADGAVTRLWRAQTASTAAQEVGSSPPTDLVSSRYSNREFFHDTAGRRLGSTDPDTDDPNDANGATRTWRYLFNEVGDLVAVRDSRGCGQNFYFDQAGRLIGEDYVMCAAAQLPGDVPTDTIPATAISHTGERGASRTVDVRYYFDGEDPGWTGFSTSYGGTSSDAGRLTATADRAQRSKVAYDPRGNPVWTARQMAFLSAAATNVPATLSDPPAVFTAEDITSPTRMYDEDHTYERTQSYDHAGRPTVMTLPTDPDWTLLGGTGTAPVVAGDMTYVRRGLPDQIRVTIDGTPYDVVRKITYERDGQPERIYHGDDQGGARAETYQEFQYDIRRRLTRTFLERAADPGATPPNDLGAVTRPFDQGYAWDGANNLTSVSDDRLETEWPAGFRPQQVDITHDALYRVIGADYTYHQSDGSWTASDATTDWRVERTRVNTDATSHGQADPMREVPAPMLPAAPANRVVSLNWEYDWLANMTAWTADDGAAFYERSIGRNDPTDAGITNGFDVSKRPSALYLATNLPITDPGSGGTAVDRGGWLDVEYGEGGNVVAMTAHAQCHDKRNNLRCWDDTSLTLDGRRSQLRSNCVCDAEQHYQYRWDELNRLAEARRYDRDGSGTWSLEARQRYRYDGGNVRMIKETLGSPADRVHLYVYPGDYDRSGLVRNAGLLRYDASTSLGTETQYLVAGARVVWKLVDNPADYTLSRDVRISYAVTDLLGSTSAVVDLQSSKLLEVSTYYPNGAVETHRTQQAVSMQPELLGFTGKEADDEVGVVYFGERYLIPRIGRWASPDPLHVHAVGGGEALNSYHYLSGSLLQANDPVGLCDGDGTGCRDAGLPGGAADTDSHGGTNGPALTQPGTEWYANNQVSDWIEIDDPSEAFLRDVAEMASGWDGTVTAERLRGYRFAIRQEGGSFALYREDHNEGWKEWPPGGSNDDLSLLIGAAGVARAVASRAGGWISRSLVSRSRIPGVGAFSSLGGAFFTQTERLVHRVTHRSGLTARVTTGYNGRIEQTTARLNREFLGRGTAPSSASRRAISQAGLAGDDAGHLIASRLGGAGGARAQNTIAQLAAVNRGQFRQWEAWIAEQVDAGKHVVVSVQVRYGSATAERASQLIYTARVNGVSHVRSFTN